MSRGQLVPDETIVRVFLDRLEAADAADGAILDGFPRTRVQAEALDDALAEAGRRVDLAGYIDVPLEDLVDADGQPADLHRQRPRLQPRLEPAARRRRLRPRRLGARPSAPTTHEATVRARMAQQVPPLLEVVDHYRDRGVLTTVDGRLGDRRRHRRAADGPRRRRSGLTMVTRKSRVGDRADAPRRPRRRRGPRPDRGRAAAGRLDRRTSTPSPRRTSGRPAAIPSFKGYPGINPRRPFPASVCISIDDEIVHGIPGERTIRAGQIVSVDAGAIVDGWHGDARADVLRRRPAARGRRAHRPDPRGDDGRHRGGRARQPHRGHLGRGRGGRRAGRPRRHPPVRRPRHRHRDARGAAGPELPHRPARAASSSPACAWRSSRCSRSAATTPGSSPTTGRSSPPTARWRPISSIRSP